MQLLSQKNESVLYSIFSNAILFFKPLTITVVYIRFSISILSNNPYSFLKY